MGFSAGGHLAASLASHYADIKISNNENISLRPDFQILIYPVITTKSFGHAGSTLNLIGPNPSEDQINYFSNEIWVNAESPIAFIVHAKDDDAVPVKNAEIYYETLIKNKVASKLFLFEKGGHGFGMHNKMAEKQWPPIMEAWLFENKIL
jgi:acetyl esterase/lipase